MSFAQAYKMIIFDYFGIIIYCIY